MSLKTEVNNHLKNKEFETLKVLINKLDTGELINLLYSTDNEKSLIIYRLLSKEKALDVFEHMDVSVQQRFLATFADEKAVEIFASLQPDDRIRLMDELPAAVAKRLLSSLSQSERDITSALLGYKTGTAGRVMTPKYIRLRRDMTAQEALDKVRTAGKDLETIYHLYVTDNERRLEGVVSLKDIVLAKSDTVISDIMNKTVKVNTDTEDEDVAQIFRQYDLFAVPVVDMENRLVGAITVDDALYILEEEAAETALDKAGFTELSEKEADRSKILMSGPIVKVWRVRIPFLIITLIGGILAGLLVQQYEETLAAVTAVAFFMPMVMDMGGNVGTQSATIFSRALVLGQINFKNFMKQWTREIFVGASMGIILGSAAGIFAGLWQGISLGIVVAVSLAVTITIATTLGFLVPYLLIKLGLDQVAGTSPIITTIKDITGLFVYFFLVTLFLL